MKTISSLTLAGLVCAWVISATAQPNTENPPNQRPQGRQFQRGQMGGMQAMQAGRMAFFYERVLTEDQRTSFRDAMEKQRDKMRSFEEKIRDARQDLLKATVAEKFDEDAVRAKAVEIGKLDAEVSVLRAKALSQMKPALSAEQIEQLKNPPPFEGGGFRPGAQGQGNDQRPNARKAPGARDENDLPPKPKAEN